MLKPLVSIVVATYFPRTDFFEKQLRSLNGQTYENIEIIICDDSANDAEYEKVKKMAEKIIYRFPYKVIRNEENVGSNKTFERLTKEANGDYICYCDQDDIWLAEKVERLVNHIIQHHCTLVYSDLSLMDENDRVIHKSFKRSNFRLKHVHGDNTFAHLINRNSVTGCAMMIRTDVAKSAIPFPDYDEYVHDHWLAIHAAARGSLGYMKKPLVLYRIHSRNQIGNKRLANIININDYILYRIEKQVNKYYLILERLPLTLQQRQLVCFQIQLTQARKKFSQKPCLSNFLKMVPLVKYDTVLFLFELVVFILPFACSTWIFKKLKY
ncbi:glycosyltransferase family 2 protein [Anoxybacillus ayderensis G10]|uniref:glycosyltransferase family 2 protein n=1 Tax=Anoxybacillus gonensis TaxID=198467 RepID=UPI0002FBB692|nr:glycosyltransferase family 2 protein [Anoxybacillus ayderensis G10]